MKIKQIGNGSAFNTNMTNSSFLISLDKEYMLFDCGYSVFAKLKEIDTSTDEFELKKLKTVFISHMDDDHMGSLKTLIYYQYFINNIIMNIFVGKEVKPLLEVYLSDLDSILVNGIKQKTNLFNLYIIDALYNSHIEFSTINTVHGKPCYGLKVLDIKNKKIFLISGDTKANMYFYRELKAIPEDYNSIVFHDFSKWDNEGSQVHACEEDFDLFYSDYKHKIIKYHNDEPFQSSWFN